MPRLVRFGFFGCIAVPLALFWDTEVRYPIWPHLQPKQYIDVSFGLCSVRIASNVCDTSAWWGDSVAPAPAISLSPGWRHVPGTSHAYIQVLLSNPMVPHKRCLGLRIEESKD